MSRQLPPNPNLEFLRKQAKELLREMQQRDPACKLTDEHALARDYGFASWPKLKAHLESMPKTTNPFVGTWIADVSRSRQHPLNRFDTATLNFHVEGDTVTITDVVVDASGHGEHSKNILQVDGKEHSSEGRSRYVVLAKWLSTHVLETVVRKDGQLEGRVMYEISADGMTLTISTDDQVVVFDRQL